MTDTETRLREALTGLVAYHPVDHPAAIKALAALALPQTKAESVSTPAELYQFKLSGAAAPYGCEVRFDNEADCLAFIEWIEGDRSAPRPPPGKGEQQINFLQLAKDVHRHWYSNFNMPCLSHDACVEAANILQSAMATNLYHVLQAEEVRHTDRSIPCPTCGFVIRQVERKPFVIEDDTAAASAPVSTEEVVGVPRWRHLKRGTTYTEVGRAKLQASDPGGLADMGVMVIYCSETDGSLWVCPQWEFEDGRFEKLSASPPPPDVGMTEEEIARAIWESQRDRIGNKEGFNARLKWRSSAAPNAFWDSYFEDARAVLVSITTPPHDVGVTEIIIKALEHAKTDYGQMVPYVSNREGAPYGLLQTQTLINDALAHIKSKHGGTP